jgi:hypothetical protein
VCCSAQTDASLFSNMVPWVVAICRANKVCIHARQIAVADSGGDEQL